MKKEVVEYAGIPVGIVVPESGMLRFVAVKFHVIDLDKKLFQSVKDVQIAIREHLSAALLAA